MAPSSKDRDIELWKAWKRTKSPMDLQPLLKQFEGLVNKEVNRWGGVIAREVLEMEGLRLAKQAFETYDPKAGTALSTHVTNYLQKLSRTVYEHQNLARIPEYQTLKIKQFEKARSDLESQLGRDPSASELASKLMWSLAAVEELRTQMRRESLESKDTHGIPVAGYGAHDSQIHLVYHDLTPMQKVVFEHKTGYGGAPVLSGDELMKKTKLSQGQLSYELNKIKDKFKSVL